MHFSINRTICVDNAIERKNKNFRQAALFYLKKKKYCCELCSFNEPSLQQVITRDGKYQDDSYTEDNLMVVCPHCFYGCRLGYSAVNDAIDLIYCPTISQSAINHLTRILTYYTDTDDGSYLEEIAVNMTESELELKNSISHIATSILIELDQARLYAKTAYKGYDPTNITQTVSFLFQTTEEDYAKRDRFFEPFRYILKPKVAKQLNKKYSHTIFKSYTPEKIKEQAEQFISIFNDAT